MEVIIVHGPPGAGKTTYVQEQSKEGDLIVDFDALYAALSGLPWYHKPAELLPFVAEARDAVIRRLSRPSKIKRAWIITSEPNGQKRLSLKNKLGATVVKLEVSREECLRRIANDTRRSDHVHIHKSLVDDWWSNYTGGDD